MKYIIKKEQLKEFIAQIDSKLNNIQVSGDSVGNLYISRMMLKELFDSIEQVEEPEKLDEQ
jgi:hypothetical protein